MSRIVVLMGTSLLLFSGCGGAAHAVYPSVPAFVRAAAHRDHPECAAERVRGPHLEDLGGTRFEIRACGEQMVYRCPMGASRCEEEPRSARREVRGEASGGGVVDISEADASLEIEESNLLEIESLARAHDALGLELPVATTVTGVGLLMAGALTLVEDLVLHPCLDLGTGHCAAETDVLLAGGMVAGTGLVLAVAGAIFWQERAEQRHALLSELTARCLDVSLYAGPITGFAVSMCFP